MKTVKKKKKEKRKIKIQDKDRVNESNQAMKKDRNR